VETVSTPTVCPIVVMGAIASGKSTVASLLSDKLGWPTFSFGAYVREQALERGITPQRYELEALGSALINERGYDGFLGDVLASRSSATFILEGVRHPRMLRAVRERYPSVLSFFLDLSTDVRYKRWRLREAMPEDSAARSKFDSFRQAQVERFVSSLRQAADHVVDADRPAPVVAAEILAIVTVAGS
jgi:adenylate kinase family enzyme